MLRINELVVQYSDRRAVDRVSLDLGPGEIVTLVGPTGCGKSSLLRAIAGFEQFSAGQIQLADQVLLHTSDMPAEQRQTGLVFQDFALFPHMSVRDNIMFRVTDEALAEAWIDKLGLRDHSDAMPATLSGGQKQRVALARTLAHQPKLVLLDEPLSSLDAHLKNSLRWQIRTALKEAGTPALWVTHDQDEALTVADRIGVMHEGKLAQIDEPEACYRAPATRFVATFLGDGVFVRGSLATDALESEIGAIPVSQLQVQDCVKTGDAAEVLIRPHDLSLQLSSNGNAHIVWSRYEGESRLYGLEFAGGSHVRVRTQHDQVLRVGDCVKTTISANHKLPVFAATPTASGV
ncbi:MAG: ABC transporter ATP-binding protein [Pseudomonadota bacterium]